MHSACWALYSAFLTWSHDQIQVLGSRFIIYLKQVHHVLGKTGVYMLFIHVSSHDLTVDSIVFTTLDVWLPVKNMSLLVVWRGWKTSTILSNCQHPGLRGPSKGYNSVDMPWRSLGQMSCTDGYKNTCSAKTWYLLYHYHPMYNCCCSWCYTDKIATSKTSLKLRHYPHGHSHFLLVQQSIRRQT